ncbi:glycoside hydrolase family 44 protein [soil metagenome]
MDSRFQRLLNTNKRTMPQICPKASFKYKPALVCSVVLLAFALAKAPIRPTYAGPELVDPAQANTIVIQIDASANRHAINPLIYGTAWATPAQLLDLNAPLNRAGGNTTSRYNWQLNADNRANDWYFESIAYPSAVPGEVGDTFIQDSKNGGAQPMLTIPLTDWVAKVGPNRQKLSSFSISKYGAQTGSDSQWFPDAGNGVRTNGQNVTGNDLNDANVPNSVGFQQGWVQHLIGRWGNSANSGLRYYLLDNESSIWFSTHRDVQPAGVTMDDMFSRMRNYAVMIKDQDAGAQIVGPEEWGWGGYLYSGYDLQYSPNHGYTYPDRTAHGNMDYTPWLLQQFKNYENQNGRRLLDVFSLHCYPQGGESGDDVSTAIQLKRNRSTRSLWDPNYTDESWINTPVKLIPRMKGWVAQYYPNTKIGRTEDNWGAEGQRNGATAQADILGILGREGMDMATRWTTPDAATPTYKAMKMFRNYDGQGSGFGTISVSAVAPNADEVSAFASIRASDNALTVIVINKTTASATTAINLANFSAAGTSQVWQLTSANQITRLADSAVTGGAVNISLPLQSITFLIVAPTQIASPTNLAGSRVGNSAGLTWQDNSPDEDGFVIERAVGNTGNYVEIFRTASNQTTYRAAMKFGSYSYRIRTLRGGFLSTPSNVVQLAR